jgi:phosphoglycolate phosphatase
MTIRLLVCDLDNTLYDWVGYFVPALYAMVDEAVRITGCDRETLLDDLREVHRRHHDAEHPFALLEAECIRRLFAGRPLREIADILDPAFHAFNHYRKEHLALYPGVRQGLDGLSRAGVLLVAHTESKLYSVVDRVSRLELTTYFRRIYCRERAITQHPNPDVAARWLSRFPMSKVVELSHHQRKPDPDVLLEICRDEGVPPRQTAYVGDSIARDILMAKDADVFAVWAKYGASHDKDLYERLVRVTHWTADDVAREHQLRERARTIKPDYVL